MLIPPFSPFILARSMDFLIKKYPGGALTTYIHEMKPGEELAFKGPLPKHQWKANEFEHVGLIAGGTGISASLSLLFLLYLQRLASVDEFPAC